MPWRLIAAFVGVMAFAAALVGGVWKAYDLGHEAGKAEMAAVLAEWKLSIAEQAAERRKAQREQLAQLQGELDELRSRPEKVRTVTRTVRVEPDDRCDSLPPSYLRLWNAGYESGVRVGAATAATGLDHASRVALADAAESIRIARERFEANAAALTALQHYIRSVVLQENGE